MTGSSIAIAEPAQRILWLTYQRLPHPDVVVCPGDEQDVRLVLSLLSYPIARRNQIANRLKQIVAHLQSIPVIDRPSIPARTTSGLYRLMNWRLAFWLSHALAFEGSLLEDTRQLIEQWLAEGADGEVLRTGSASAT